MSEATNPMVPELEDKYFLGRVSEELSDLIASQTAELFARRGITIPPKSCSLMLAANAAGSASARDLAAALSRSHQLISQKLPKLLKLGLLEDCVDPEDARQRLYTVTTSGKEQLLQFKRLQVGLQQLYERLADETGDVGHCIRMAIQALSDRPLSERIELI